MSDPRVLPFVPTVPRPVAVLSPSGDARVVLQGLNNDLQILAIEAPALLCVFAELAARATLPYRNDRP